MESGCCDDIRAKRGNGFNGIGIGKGLNRFAELIQQIKGHDFRHLSGGGAAGGISVAAAAFMNAKFKPGIDIVIDAVKLEQEIFDTDLVIVGKVAWMGKRQGKRL